MNATGVLVECPLCEGLGVLDNNHPDPQLREDGDCHACQGGGAVTREHHAEIVDEFSDSARAERAVRRLADEDVEQQRLADELARDRDREWWS